MITKEFYLALLAETPMTGADIASALTKNEITRVKQKIAAAARRLNEAEKEKETTILHAVLTKTPMTGADIASALVEDGITWTKQKVAAVAKRLIKAGMAVKTPQIVEGRIYQFYSIVE